MTAASHIFRGKGCHVCSGSAPVDEADVRTRLADRPDVEVVHYGGTVGGRSTFRCPKGHEWETTTDSVLRGSGCLLCSQKGAPPIDETEVRRRLADRTDIELVRYAGTVMGRSTVPLPEGHEWETAAVGPIGGSGCAQCATYGFNPTKPTWIYLIRHDEHLALKIGITNVPRVRVEEQHRRRGWHLVQIWPIDGYTAQHIEDVVSSAGVTLVCRPRCRKAPTAGPKPCR